MNYPFDKSKTVRPAGRIIPEAPTEPERFLAWATGRDGRFELAAGGMVTTQAGASRFHNMICTNLVAELVRLLDRSHYAVSHADFAVRMEKSVRYPDIVVDRPLGVGNLLETSEPLFIAEVLSPPSIGVDFLEKAPEYQSLATLRCYLICSQDEPRVWIWNRRRDRTWPAKPREIAGFDETAKIAGLNIELGLADIYRGLPPQPGKA